jgi:hypothetical protein
MSPDWDNRRSKYNDVDDRTNANVVWFGMDIASLQVEHYNHRNWSGVNYGNHDHR